MEVMRILPDYFRRLFVQIFIGCLVAVVLVFIVTHLVENLDEFIDKSVPLKVTVLYYLYHIPYTVVITSPIATLLAAVFSIGSLARNNELVALKALGYSLYRVMGTLLVMGLIVSGIMFVVAEGVTIKYNRRREEIQTRYLEQLRGSISSRIRNLEIQEPPNQIIYMGVFDGENQVATQVKVETFVSNRLVSRVDAPAMFWDGDAWVISRGFERTFNGDQEEAKPIRQPRRYTFQFDPDQLLRAQIKPDEMSFRELSWFVRRVRQSGGEVRKWMTELHLRIAFPLANLMIVLFSIPLVYNRRKKSLTTGFGIALVICFLYFGLVRMGQTMGEKGSVYPWIAAWMGNAVMIAGGLVNVVKTRK